MKPKSAICSFVLSALLISAAPAATTSFDIQSGSNTQSGFTGVSSFPASDGTVSMTVDTTPSGFRDRGVTVDGPIDGNPDAAILRDLAFWSTADPVTFTFSGLQANQEYSALAWVFDANSGNNGKNIDFTTAGGSGGGTISIPTTNNNAAYAALSPFSLVNFTSTAGGTATIIMDYTSGSASVSFVNGFQLTAIPEPSAALLGGLGLLALLRRRRA